MHGTGRIPVARIVRGLQRVAADIVCLQEVQGVVRPATDEERRLIGPLSFTAVRIHGLSSRPDLNGALSLVVAQERIEQPVDDLRVFELEGDGLLSLGDILPLRQPWPRELLQVRWGPTMWRYHRAWCTARSLSDRGVCGRGGGWWCC